VTLPEPLNSYDPQSPARSPKKESRASVPALSAVSTEAPELSAAANHQSEKRALALVLDLSGDKRASAEWVARELPRAQIQSINKTDLKWGSKREALALVRDLRPDVFAVFTADLRTQSARSAMALFGMMAGARLTVFGDSNGRVIHRSRVSAFAIDAPRLALELLFGYLVMVPLSWLLTEALSLSLRFRETVRASRSRRATNEQAPLAGLYVKASPVGNSPAASAGGMATHVAGFMGGALALGHALKLLTSDDAGRRGEGIEGKLISPSSLVTATRALFELWNNLGFTARSLGYVRTLAASGQIDFIYQRYNRFNWTAVVLSLLTGLPLALEFNGSEVWISENWDPVGLMWLLRRFERLNLKAADHIFVVSEVERKNLLAAGIASNRIVVNPNGVDVDRFRPDCGGRETRAALGISDKIVVGFLGSFGPWHGAPVLAEAARRISAAAGCHFLFIGDGEQRSTVEGIIDSAGKSVSATFVGRVSHAEAPAYLDACDIFAAPNVPGGDGSEFFGSPTKLFEYMAMARPLVGSRLGQIAEVIDDGSNGLLVEPGDPQALAIAIERLAADEDLRARLGAAARQTVIARYTWRHNAERVFDAMRSSIHPETRSRT
jgi:glycosyltransferase involved in cell wall biosynthesis